MALREVFARFTTRFDSKALTRGNDKVKGLIEGFKGAAGAARALGPVIAAMAVAAVIHRWIVALNEFVEGMTALGDEIDKTSQSLGISTTALQEWRHAGTLSGVQDEALTASLRGLTVNLAAAAANGASPAAAEFRRLGVSVKDSEGNLRDATDVLQDMADPLNELESSTQRNATLMLLMGEQGAMLGPMMAAGSEGIGAMRAELEELGGGASPEMIQAAIDLADAQARLDLAFLSLKSRLATSILPIFEAVTEAITSVVAWFAEHETATTALKIVLGVLTAAVVILAVILGGALAIVLAIVLSLLWALVLVLSPLLIPFALWVLIIQDLYVWLAGGESVIGTFIEALLSLAGISMEDVRREISELMTTLTNAYNAVARAVGLPTIDPSAESVAKAAPDPESEKGRAAAEAEAAGVVAAEAAQGNAEAEAAEAAQGGPGEVGGVQGFVQGLRIFAAGNLAESAAGEEEARKRARRIRSEAAGRTARREGLAARAANVRMDTRFTITGNDPVAIGEEVSRVMDRQNRDAAEALGQ